MWTSLDGLLVRWARQAKGCSPTSSVGIIDFQGVPTTESGGPRGLNPAKRIEGRKRHIVTDTQGHLLESLVRPASVRDEHGAVPLLGALGRSYPTLRHVPADRV